MVNIPGLKVYRYKGLFLSDYGHYDEECEPDPSDYGLQILHEIPDDKEEFEEWVKIEKEYLDEQYDQWKADPTSLDYVDITDEQPHLDLVVDWLYEIDLDHLVFHVNFQPLFRLDNMPPDDIFLRSILSDYFGHTALDKSTPVQYRHDWHTPPPPPSPESLAAYKSYHNRSSACSVHELLCISPELLPVERARTTLVEILVVQCMINYFFGRHIRVLENVPDRNHIREVMLGLAFSLVNFAVGAPFPTMPLGSIDDFRRSVWIRKDVLVCITTHLDDENTLHAAIGDLVHSIGRKEDKQGTIYGIVCSIFHCAIVRIDKDVCGSESSFTHTPSLQFLPSFYARNISTPGIEALSRLGCHTNGVEFLEEVAEEHDLPLITHKELLATGSVVTRVSVEVWMNVGQYIASPKDLVTLASISPQAMTVAADLARYPCVQGFRLTDSAGPMSPASIYGAKGFCRILWRALFKAVKGGRLVNVVLSEARGRPVNFEAKTFLNWKNELCISVPDDE